MSTIPARRARRQLPARPEPAPHRRRPPARPSGAGDRAAARPERSGASGARRGKRSGNGPGTRLATAADDPAAASRFAADVIAADEDLKTAFFLSDSTFGPYSQTRAEDVVPPRSIVARDGPPQPPAAETGRQAMAGDEAAGRLAPADPDPQEEQSASRRNRARSTSPPGAVEDDDPDVAAANLLARQAREAYRGGAGSRRSSRSQAASRWPAQCGGAGPR